MGDKGSIDIDGIYSLIVKGAFVFHPIHVLFFLVTQPSGDVWRLLWGERVEEMESLCSYRGYDHLF